MVSRANPWRSRRILDYAHQGGSFEAPSSTLFAIGRAIEIGADGIELDVHATKDGHLVVCHDATVDRTSDGHGAIASLTLDELRALDNAYRFVPGTDATFEADEIDYLYRGRAPEDPAFGIATLEDVLSRFPGVLLNLDIKQTAPAVVSYEVNLAQTLRRFTRRDDVIVASFLDLALARFNEAAPEIPTSAGTLATLAFWRSVRDGAPIAPRDAVALQVPMRRGEVVVIDQGFVDAAHDCDLAVHVWTVNEPSEMNWLIELGVDGIVTDRPSVLSALLAEAGVNWKRG